MKRATVDFIRTTMQLHHDKAVYSDSKKERELEQAFYMGMRIMLEMIATEAYTIEGKSYTEWLNEHTEG